MDNLLNGNFNIGSGKGSLLSGMFGKWIIEN